MTHFTPTQRDDYRQMANAIRALTMDAVEQANSGHPGMPLGMADVATVLFRDFLSFMPQDPQWFKRDRFVLSAGHGSMLLYSLLYLCGYPEMTLDELKNFRKLQSKTPGHPEYGHTPGVETTTGPLGQGLANAVGMAIAEARLRAEFGEERVGHRTYALVGDGCLMEGIAQEAISLAGHLQLSRLIVLFDDNGITIDGPTSLSTREDMKPRFEGAGWHVLTVDGHDVEAVYNALEEAQSASAPILIQCRTTIAYGAPTKAGSSMAHGAPLGKEEVAAAKRALGWHSAPFEVPCALLDMWRESADRCKPAYEAWQKLWEDETPLTQELKRRVEGRLHPQLEKSYQALRTQWQEAAPTTATRQASQAVLEALMPSVPEWLGGSADLTPSNNTKVKPMVAIKAGAYAGQYVHYGVREHGMAAAMNGIALHKGLRPYGGTFLAFADYCRPAIRLAALMEQGVTFVMTHDSIGLGEDGPTHQPVEHLASLRAIPHLRVYRPADALETLECWYLTLTLPHHPAIIALSRQALPPISPKSAENLCARGAYVVKEASDTRQVTLLATGSEVHLAVTAQAQLEQEGVATAVVSMPCWELFEEQDAVYRRHVLGDHGKRVAVEAAVSFGWGRYLRDGDAFVGMHSFGASAPAKELFETFGITVDAIVAAAKDR